jgi:hypothetical protein
LQNSTDTLGAQNNHQQQQLQLPQEQQYYEQYTDEEEYKEQQQQQQQQPLHPQEPPSGLQVPAPAVHEQQQLTQLLPPDQAAMANPDLDPLSQAAFGRPSLATQTTLLQAPLDYTSIVLELARQVLQLQAAQPAQQRLSSQQAPELQQLLSLAALLNKHQPTPKQAYPLHSTTNAASQAQAPNKAPVDARLQPATGSSHPTQPSAAEAPASQAVLEETLDGLKELLQASGQQQQQRNATAADPQPAEEQPLEGHEDDQQTNRQPLLADTPQPQLPQQQHITNSTSEGDKVAASPDMHRSQDTVTIAIPEADPLPSQPLVSPEDGTEGLSTDSSHIRGADASSRSGFVVVPEPAVPAQAAPTPAPEELRATSPTVADSLTVAEPVNCIRSVKAWEQCGGKVNCPGGVDCSKVSLAYQRFTCQCLLD